MRGDLLRGGSAAWHWDRALGRQAWDRLVPQPGTTVTRWLGHGAVGARLPGTKPNVSPTHTECPPLCHGLSHGPCRTHISLQHRQPCPLLLRGWQRQEVTGADTQGTLPVPVHICGSSGGPSGHPGPPAQTPATGPQLSGLAQLDAGCTPSLTWRAAHARGSPESGEDPLPFRCPRPRRATRLSGQPSSPPGAALRGSGPLLPVPASSPRCTHLYLLANSHPGDRSRCRPPGSAAGGRSDTGRARPGRGRRGRAGTRVSARRQREEMSHRARGSGFALRRGQAPLAGRDPRDTPSHAEQPLPPRAMAELRVSR